jgi:hypothetical protein
MSQAPCIDCKSGFVKSAIKLRQNHAEACIASVKHLFLMVKEQSNVSSMLTRRHAAKLDWTAGPEMFDNFEEVLQDAALVKWETQMQNLAPAHQTKWSASIKLLKNVFWNRWLHLPKIT